MKPLASLLFVAVIVLGHGCQHQHLSAECGFLGVTSRCPPYWTYFQGNCYRYGDKRVSWPDAQVFCQTQSGTLAEVSSSQENDFLKSMARDKRDNCVWLGAYDIFNEGVWESASSSNTFNRFTNWGNGQPNNQANGQDCLNMHTSLNYDWNDESCATGCNFICSRPSTDINES